MMHIFFRISTVLLILSLLTACQPNTNAVEEKEELSEDEKIYFPQGSEIIFETQKTLGSNLMSAMKKGGVQYALSFCNLNAFAIKDSLSKIYNVDIRRKSKKYRNPADKPNEIEAQVINDYEKAALEGKSPSFVIKSIDDNHIGFYAPILLGDFCLKCHGTVGKELLDTDYADIKKLYPEDLAIGYKSGDLRGIWSLTFEQN